MIHESKRSTDKAEIVGHYMDQGIRLVRLKSDDRKPLDTAWQDPKQVDHPREVFEDHVRCGGALAWQLGTLSGELAVVDNDWELAVKLAPWFLPETLRGAKGNEAPSHYAYHSPGLGYAQFNGLDGSRIIDVKASNNGAGHYVTVEPTIHPTKGAYRFVQGYNPAAIETVAAAVLERQVRLLATSALIAANLPPSREEGGGGRHDFGLALWGYMLRNGEPVEDVEKVSVVAWGARGAPRDAIRDIRSSIPDSAHRLAQDGRVKGGHSLEELVPGLPRRIAQFLDWPDRRMEEANPTFPRTDMGNAERLVARHGHRIRYCFRWKSWLIYDGLRWKKDDGGGIRRLAKDTVRGIYEEAAAATDSNEREGIAKHAVASEKEARVNSMIALARSEVEITYTELDTDIYLLNAENGTIDLRTGELRDHDPADYITKLCGTHYDPDAEAPLWEQHLERVLRDSTVRGYFQRAGGHSFSGNVDEDALFIPYGTGGNGKTVTYEALLAAAGDYGMSAAPDLLLAKDRAHPTELADLHGARLVVSMEAEEGRRLAESLVKRLTGGDKIKARRMHEDFWEFPPTHKFHMSVNHKPEIRGTDEGIWRRVKLIPFTEHIPESEKDVKLGEKLLKELPGILAWTVRGCVDWYEDGLREPKAVTEATNEYRSEMDVLAAFLEDRCVVAEDAIAPATQLYKQYEMWCDEAGEKRATQKMFGMRLRERGFRNEKITRGPYKALKGWLGIGIKVDDLGPNGAPDDDGGGGGPTHPGPDAPSQGNSVDDRPPGKNSSFAGDYTLVVEDGGRSGAKSDLSSLVEHTRANYAEKRSTSSTSSTPAPYTLQADRPAVPDSHLTRPGDGAVSLERTKIRGAVYNLFRNPPAWLPIQVGMYVEAPEERLIKPLTASVAHTLGYKMPDIPDDVRLQVERELEAELNAGARRSA